MATIDLQERGARQPEETERAHHDRAANVGADHHVLVIGGAGYVGNVLTRKLLARGYRVRCLDIFFIVTAARSRHHWITPDSPLFTVTCVTQ
jgi:hypothetical protein